MDKAVRGLVEGRYEWIAFTSVNAVKAVREKFEEYGLDARAFSASRSPRSATRPPRPSPPGACAPTCAPGEQSAAGLLEDWPEYDEVLDPINRVFLLKRRHRHREPRRRPDRPGLGVRRRHGVPDRAATPPPAPTRDAIKSGKFDAVVSTSSSTVRNLVGIAGKPHPSTRSR